MLNFDNESIKVVKGDSTGAINATGTLTIVGLPDEFFKKLVIASLALITFYTNAISDNHDIVKNNTNAEEPLPLNDPFVGDSSQFQVE